MYRKSPIRFLLLALLFALAATQLLTSAATRQETLAAQYTGIKITLDGAELTPRDANGRVVEPFAADGTTYLPVRAVAEVLGLDVVWDGEANTVRLTRPSAERSTIHVSTAREFLDAIAPDTEIILAPGDYDLTAEYPYAPSVYVRWDEVFDWGVELIIDSVSNLIIRGEDRDACRLLASPSYADVLRFECCQDIRFSNLTAGHAPEGHCRGDVLSFYDCRSIALSETSLFGCGTYGLELESCTGVSVTDSAIYDCTYGAVAASGSNDIVFTRCEIYENQCFHVFYLREVRNFAVRDSVIRDNISPGDYGWESMNAFELYDCHNISASGTFFEDNALGVFVDPHYHNVGDIAVSLDGCTFRGNLFDPPV